MSIASFVPTDLGSGPPPEPATERAFRDLVRTIGLLERVMQPQFARFGISGSQWAALRTLHRAELEGQDNLRITDLSDRLLIRPPSVTGVIDRLERGQLVVRDPAPDDLRSRCIRLTDRGRQLVSRVTGVYGEQVERALGGLRPDDQTELQRLLGRLSAHLQSLLEESDGAIPAQSAPEMTA
jgi:DNA-binding MarR family transcriptional regulator